MTFESFHSTINPIEIQLQQCQIFNLFVFEAIMSVASSCGAISFEILPMKMENISIHLFYHYDDDMRMATIKLTNEQQQQRQKIEWC